MDDTKRIETEIGELLFDLMNRKKEIAGLKKQKELLFEAYLAMQKKFALSNQDREILDIPL